MTNIGSLVPAGMPKRAVRIARWDVINQSFPTIKTEMLNRLRLAHTPNEAAVASATEPSPCGMAVTMQIELEMGGVMVRWSLSFVGNTVHSTTGATGQTSFTGAGILITDNPTILTPLEQAALGAPPPTPRVPYNFTAYTDGSPYAFTITHRNLNQTGIWLPVNATDVGSASVQLSGWLSRESLPSTYPPA